MYFPPSSSSRLPQCLRFHSFRPHPSLYLNFLSLKSPKSLFSISCSIPHSLAATSTLPSSPGPVVKKRKRYRKPCPGESKGIVEEMRFVAMKLRNNHAGKGKTASGDSRSAEENGEADGDGDGDGDGETWQPSMEGFLKYLVDSKLVFDTVEHIVNESTDVTYVYFRKTGLERSAKLSKDLEWFQQKNILIPEPSVPGTTYATYLTELAEKSPPSFLCHFYNIYFAHLAGGQEIGQKVCDILLKGKELEFYKWDRDVHEILKDMRGNLNKLGEHWSRDEKNTCLRESAKSFRFLGQIIRLIILE